MTTENPSVIFNDYTWLKIWDFIEIYLSSGALVPSDDHLLLMEYSSKVFPSEVFIFVSKMATVILVGFITSEKPASQTFYYKYDDVLYTSVWKDTKSFMVGWQIIGINDIFYELMTGSIHVPYII